VADFLDLAETAGVGHVTYLSTYGGDQAPPEIDIRAVETDLAGRGTITHSILRPAWVMQNFSDAHLPIGRLRPRRLRGDAPLADRGHHLPPRLQAQRRHREGHRPTAEHLPRLRPAERPSLDLPSGQVIAMPAVLCTGLLCGS
jgi:uncharacterized protein YbjT (DUF2867 family)